MKTQRMLLSRTATFSLAALLVAAGLYLATAPPSPSGGTGFGVPTDGLGEAPTTLPRASIETKRARAEYFLRLLRDPATNTIPANIRQRELAFARTLPQYGAGKTAALALNWQEAGPNDVGGRTRAFAVDIANPNVLIAGGISGGIWKSTDRGQTWTLKSDPTQVLGVTSLVQDPRPGLNNTWYYVTGEFLGNSASDQSQGASFFGSGFYRSTNNGETWQELIDAGDPTAFDSPFDRASKVIVSPTTGSVFVATNAFGILRSTDGGASFALSLGGVNEHIWSDVTTDADGFLLAVISDPFQGTQSSNPPGIYLSTDDGVSWTNLTQAFAGDFPASFQRSVIACAPSNPNVAYLLTWTGFGAGADEDVRFHKLDFATQTIEDRSANLPNFGGDVGFIDSQGAYNMTITVKPDDEDFVLFGTTNLYRSRDGFATPADFDTENWIGGYATANDISQYRNHHPDQHVLVFDPTNPDRLYSGHDGGLSVIDNIATDEPEVNWQSLNNGYNITQFYHVTQPAQAGDIRLAGGAQDNGTPFFRFDGVTTTPSEDISSGDGSYAHFGQEIIISSSQQGRLLAFTNDPNAELGFIGDLTPPDATNQLFINPFVVDPNGDGDETVYYLGGAELWRSDFTDFDVNCGNDVGACWQRLDDLTLPDGFIYTTLATTHTSPTALYLGITSGGQPAVFRFDNAATATTGAVNVSIPGAPEGAYVHDIAVNPEDGNEIIVVLSNYNIVGLYHSTDGGQSYTAIEGNLEGDANNPGPSLRSATILPFGGTTTYLVGTSVGAFSTTALNGANTTWQQEAATELGNAVVSYVTSRTSDGQVILATHGRGMFRGASEAVTDVEDAPGEQPRRFALAQNYPNPFNPSTTIHFTLDQPSTVRLSVYDLAGREVATLLAGERKAAGRHAVPFVAHGLASGSYIYRLETTDGAGAPRSDARRMILVK